MSRAAMLVLALLLAPPAWAVPGAFSTQGRLLDADGTAVDGALDMTFRLVDGETGGSTLWSERQSVSFTNGYYSVVLGADEAGNPVSDAVLDQWPLWLEVQVDGQPPMFPRTSMGSVPYARLAGRAEELVGGTVDADTLAVGGVEVVDAGGAWVGAPIAADWADLVGVPADFADGVDADLLGALACADGQALVFAAASGWTCADPSALMSAVDADISALGADLDALTLTCDANTASIGTLGGRVAVLESGALVLSSSLSALEGRVGALEALDDADTLSALSCLDGDVAKWDGVLSSWVCADDLDTRLTEAEVDAMVADNGFAADADLVGLGVDLALLESSVSDLDADLAAVNADLSAADARVSGLSGRVTTLEGTAATQGGLLTTLNSAVTALGTRISTVEAAISTLASTEFSGSFLDLSDVPAGLDDGDDDTLAGLACADGDVPRRRAAAGGGWECVALDSSTGTAVGQLGRGTSTIVFVTADGFGYHYDNPDLRVPLGLGTSNHIHDYYLDSAGSIKRFGISGTWAGTFVDLFGQASPQYAADSRGAVWVVGSSSVTSSSKFTGSGYRNVWAGTDEATTYGFIGCSIDAVGTISCINTLTFAAGNRDRLPSPPAGSGYTDFWIGADTSSSSCTSGVMSGTTCRGYICAVGSDGRVVCTDQAAGSSPQVPTGTYSKVAFGGQNATQDLTICGLTAGGDVDCTVSNANYSTVWETCAATFAGQGFTDLTIVAEGRVGATSCEVHFCGITSSGAVLCSNGYTWPT
jgi:hypothetical protein